MARWILVLQLLLLPFVWASPDVTISGDEQLCAYSSSDELTSTLPREKDNHQALKTAAMGAGFVFWVIQLFKSSPSNIQITQIPSVHLTYSSIAYLHRHLFIPPPFSV